jgi:hypothetical protein
MAALIGHDALLALSKEFPNHRIPGKKYVLRVQRKRFLANPNAMTSKQWADLLGVHVQTIYNWDKTRPKK